MAGLLDSLGYGTQGGYGGLLDFLRTQEQYQPSAGFVDGPPMTATERQMMTMTGPNQPLSGFAPPPPMPQAMPPQPVQAQAPQPEQAAPMSIGAYQMPRIGGAQAFAPQSAPTDISAQSRQPEQMPAPQQPQESPGGFGAGLQGFLQNLHTGPIGAVVGGVGSAMGMQSPAKQQANQTAQFLVSKGMDPAAAKAVVADPVLMRSILPQMLGGTSNQPAKVQEYLFAKKEDPTLTYAKFLQRERSTNEYGMQPMFTVNKETGKTEAWQLGKNGVPVKVALPPGVEIARGIEQIKTGTEIITVNKQSGEVMSRVPMNNADKEAEEKVGQARGVAQAALNNGADIDAEETKKKIDALINSEGFNEVFGQADQYRPKWSHSNKGADALARFEQLTGTAFLSAFQMLKGGGAITETEGQKAGAAMARLNRAQGEAEAKAALIDFKEAVDVGLRKLQRAASGGAAPAAAPTPAAASKRIRLNADGTIAQ